jgi:hypothetical protein
MFFAAINAKYCEYSSVVVVVVVIAVAVVNELKESSKTTM